MNVVIEERKNIDMPNKHHKKTEECICPRCLKDNTVIDDYAFDWNCMSRKMFCEDCGYMWREYFTVAYDGFADDTGEYDANGVSDDEPLKSLEELINEKQLSD